MSSVHAVRLWPCVCRCSARHVSESFSLLLVPSQLFLPSMRRWSSMHRSVPKVLEWRQLASSMSAPSSSDGSK